MKKIYFIGAASSLLFAAFSCGSLDEISSRPDNSAPTYQRGSIKPGETSSEKPNSNTRGTKSYQGIVYDKSTEDGCEFVIVADIEGNEMTFVPHGLVGEYRKDSLAVNFTYTTSDRPTKCSLGELIIISTIDKAN